MSASALHLRAIGVGACVGHGEDARPRVVQPAQADALTELLSEALQGVTLPQLAVECNYGHSLQWIAVMV